MPQHRCQWHHTNESARTWMQSLEQKCLCHYMNSIARTWMPLPQQNFRATTYVQTPKNKCKCDNMSVNAAQHKYQWPQHRCQWHNKIEVATTGMQCLQLKCQCQSKNSRPVDEYKPQNANVNATTQMRMPQKECNCHNKNASVKT